jgi:hypothetical protein
MIMRSIWFSRAARAVVALTLLSATAAATIAAAGPGPERPRRRRAANLFAVTNAVMNVNRVFCGINNLGELCVDPTNSPVVGGGFWPKGSPDQYIFNSGLQLAGVIPSTAGGGKPAFAWAGDTVGAYFFDARGTQVAGDAITLVYNSLDPADGAAWPNGAKVRDTSLYNTVLLDRDNISQQDLWTRAWDGNPAFLSGRTHPMGILVEERGLAWNYPTGNEDIIYFIFTFYNVTARNCAVYAGLDPAIQSEICAVGQNFQNRNEAVFNTPIPDDGYAIGSLYSAFSMDPDVGDAGHNYSTAILPFNMGVAYKSDFLEPAWSFPPEIFGPPFVSSPGFVGVKYLRSPKVGGVEVGLTMFSNTRNAATGFPDPVGVLQLYRYLSGTVSPAKGDNPCTVAKPIEAHLCFLDQTAADTRFYESSGPFTLNPGESQNIVVAYVHAAPLPAVVPFIGGDMKPNIPANGTEIAADPAGTIRTIERAAGWVNQTDINTPIGTITQDEVQTTPRSLLNKALVAQAVFNNKFLLPFAPEAPRFFLIPGDNQVSIVWQKSASETTGDPFYAVASRRLNTDGTANPLYDPNFRQFDVEGYRIYRGRTTGQLELVAQFDYSGTQLVDFTGNFAYTEDLDPDGAGPLTPNGIIACAPELGVQEDCPVTFATAPPYTTSVAHPLAGDIRQVPVGGRVLLANGNVLIVRADTAVTGGASGFPPLTDSGISFAFTDMGVRNAFTYYYAVTAFDVNSLKSGPSSLESPRITKSTTPRASSGQETSGQLGAVSLVGGDNATLDPTAPLPTIDPATGIFSGPMPATNGLALGFGVFPSQLLSGGTITLTVDSIVPGATLQGRPATYYMRGQGATGGSSVALPLLLDAFSGNVSNFTDFPADAYIQSKTSRFGGDSTFSIYGRVTLKAPGGYRLASWGRGDINSDPANSAHNGPRWWAGTANENVNRPNELVCTPADGACVQGDLTRNAGQLPGVSVLFHLQSYSTVQNSPPRNIEGIGATVARAADFKVYWGAAGVVDSVVDVTHHVRVPFSTKIRASWGILNAASFAGTTQATTPDANNALLTWTDAFCVDPSPRYINVCGGTGQVPAVLQNTAALNSVAAVSTLYATPPTAATGTGFTFYLNGHWFLMQMAALPANTVWNARFYAGTITGTGGAYAFRSSIRPPAVPGLRATVTYTGSSGLAANVTSDSMLQKVHTVPDPYYVTNSLEITPTTKVLKFVNMPAQAVLRIYSVSGVLVQVLTHNDPTGGGDLTWNLRNRNQQFVASGVYFYHVETPDGKSKVGRFTVVNFAQ